MTPEQIKQWAMASDFSPAPWDTKSAVFVVHTEDLASFAALVAHHEREACALVFESQPHVEHCGQEIAAAIRARGEKT